MGTHCARHAFVVVSTITHANGYSSRLVKCEVCGKYKHMQAASA